MNVAFMGRTYTNYAVTVVTIVNKINTFKG